MVQAAEAAEAAEAADQEWLTPRQSAAIIQCSYETMLGHIHLGTIRASDISASTSSRRKPIYRIHRDDLDAFLNARRNEAPQPIKPKRHRVRAGDVIEFF